jgi:hypothetical protein
MSPLRGWSGVTSGGRFNRQVRVKSSGQECPLYTGFGAQTIESGESGGSESGLGFRFQLRQQDEPRCAGIRDSHPSQSARRMGHPVCCWRRRNRGIQNPHPTGRSALNCSGLLRQAYFASQFGEARVGMDGIEQGIGLQTLHLVVTLFVRGVEPAEDFVFLA